MERRGFRNICINSWSVVGPLMALGGRDAASAFVWIDDERAILAILMSPTTKEHSLWQNVSLSVLSTR
jgi:hypothetical protein